MAGSAGSVAAGRPAQPNAAGRGRAYRAFPAAGASRGVARRTVGGSPRGGCGDRRDDGRVKLLGPGRLPVPRARPRAEDGAAAGPRFEPAGRRAGRRTAAAPAAVVCVPAKDEAGVVGDLLDALARQTRRDFEVLVLANDCRDDTAAVARRHARRLGLPARVAEVALPPAAAHVGTARRLLAGAALARFRAAGVAGGVVLTTDADTRPDPRWVATNLRAVRAGADCVCGRVKADPPDPRDDAGRVAAAWHGLRVRHRRLADRLAWLLDPDPADPWPRHHDEAGASLAVTADILGRCGGVPAVRSSEDVALVAAVRRAGGVVRHDPRVTVRTSRRRDGRCPGGLADLLNRLSRGDRPADRLVEDPRTLAARLRARGRLRRLWAGPTRGVRAWDAAAAGGPLPGCELRRRHAAGEPFGAVVADFDAAAGEPAVPLDLAVRWLCGAVSAKKDGDMGA